MRAGPRHGGNNGINTQLWAARKVYTVIDNLRELGLLNAIRIIVEAAAPRGSRHSKTYWRKVAGGQGGPRLGAGDGLPGVGHGDHPEVGLALLQLAVVAEDGMGRDKILYLAQPLQE